MLYDCLSATIRDGRDGAPAPACYGSAVTTANASGGPSGQRRIGPFWIEEGLGLVSFGAALLALVLVLYLIAAISGRS